MDPNQETRRNPFGMDEACENCDALRETRETVVHGYGDAGADVLFVAERPTEGADEAGVPFGGDDDGGFYDLLDELGFVDGETGEGPAVENAFVTHLTRCRHPDRPPSDEEVRNCDPFLNAELRMINPEILVPIGDRVLAALATEHTTDPADSFAVADDHATTIRGRGFSLVPMLPPAEMSKSERETFRSHFEELLSSDYRQTKGRRGR